MGFTLCLLSSCMFVLVFALGLTSSSSEEGKMARKGKGTYNRFHQLVCFVDVGSQSRQQRSDGER
jgi:hypothetical protein